MKRGALILGLAVLLAGCGGHSAAPSTADRKACALALYKLDIRVWVLGQPIGPNLDMAEAACYWVPKAKLRAATSSGEADYKARIRSLIG